ncbi:MAG: hypothetical protein RIS09_822, partial [Actinomycetota bacterium]
LLGRDEQGALTLAAVIFWLGHWVCAPRRGFEPRLTAPKAAVLPLHQQGK